MPSPSKPPAAAVTAPPADEAARRHAAGEPARVKTVVLLIVALVAMLLAVAWIVPPRLDLEARRGDLAALAGDRLGATVRIDGTVALRLLPEPTITASRVSIASPAATIGITVAEMRLRVALGPLLAGRLDARDLVLRGADLRLPWPLDPAAQRLRAPRWLSALSVRVEDGRLRLGAITVTGIAASLSSDAYTGTYAAAGTAHLSGHAWHVTARLTQPGSDGAVGIDVALDGAGDMLGTGGTLTGQLAADGGFAGRIAGRGPNLALLLPAPALPFQAEGRLTAADGLAAADELALTIGGAPARGAVALRLLPQPRLDLALATSRIDLDAWLPVLLRPELGQQSGVLLPTGIDLSAEAAQFAGGTLRRLRAAVDLAPGAADIREASAILPGDATLRLTGRILPGPRFDGQARLDAPALRTTLAWLRDAGATALDAVPEGVLRHAALAAHIVADPTQIAATDLAGDLDGSTIAGSLSLHRGARPLIRAVLQTDRLALDGWLPGALPRRFAAIDGELQLTARQAVLRGLTLEPLTVEATAQDGNLVLHRIAAAIGAVQVSGAVTLAAGGVVSDARLDLAAPEAAALTALLPERLALLARRTPALWKAAASVQVLGAGAPNRLALTAKATLGDLRLEAQPVVDLARGTWTAALTLRHPGAPRLLAMMGDTGALDWLGPGSLGLIAQISGAPGQLAADRFELTAGALRATGALTLDRAGAEPAAQGHIDLESLPLPLPAWRATDPLPLPDLGGWRATLKLTAAQVLGNLAPLLSGATATLTLADGTVRLDALTAQTAGGTLAAHLSLATEAAPPHFAATVDLVGASVTESLTDLPLDIIAGTLDAHAALTAEGYAPAALLATLAGDIRLDAAAGTLAGAALEAAAPLTEAAARAALAGGTTPFDALALSGRLDHGVLTLRQASLTSPAGHATLSGSYDLPDQTADLDLRLRPSADAPEIGLRLTGTPQHWRHTPDLAALTRWRAAQIGADAPP